MLNVSLQSKSDLLHFLVENAFTNKVDYRILPVGAKAAAFVSELETWCILELKTVFLPTKFFIAWLTFGSETASF